MGFFSKFKKADKPSFDQSVESLPHFYDVAREQFLETIFKNIKSEHPDCLEGMSDFSQDRRDKLFIVFLSAQLVATARFVFKQGYISTREEMDQIFYSVVPHNFLTPVTEYFTKYQEVPPDRPEVIAIKFSRDVSLALFNKEIVPWSGTLEIVYTLCYSALTEWAVASAFGDKKASANILRYLSSIS
ncbi:hypothetical protein KA996_00860 [bacterium]|nr:hypothetical protein [bacterium]